MKWTPEVIVERIREWAAEHGGEPPGIVDWNPHLSRLKLGDERRALRFEIDDRWPWFSSVIARFGSWNEAIRAAGFEPRQANGGGDNYYRRRDQRAA